jgi:pantoate--beta-alanine ligase
VSGRAQGFDSQSSREFSLAAAEATPVVRGRPRSQDDAMEIARSLSALRTACAALRSRHASLALVPTMGALHAGHLALLDAAPSGAATVASIFVNPLQFGPTEDLSRYPRDEAGDLTKLEAAGCRLVWLPDVATMYPPGDATTIEMRGPAEGWEGAARPGHFRGVATVVARLFGQVRPDAACFGEKDWQQLQVVTRMVADLLLPVRIIGVPTVREPDGLAHVLHTTAAVLATGAPAEPALIRARAALAQAGFAVDYVALVDGPTLAPLDVSKPGARLIATARLGGVRLLDNVDAAGTAAVAALSASGV